MSVVEFVVEQAGCSSCAARVQAALAGVATVETVDVDETADVAFVRVSGTVSESSVNDVLRDASRGAGHSYRVRPDSWHVQ